MIFLLSFIQDWWISIQKFIHEINPTVKIVVSSALFIVALLTFIKFIKSASKGKMKLFPLIVFMLFFAVGVILLTF